MKHSKIVMTVAILSVLVLVITVLSTLQASMPLNVDDGSLVSVPAANAVWVKTYGGAGDDRSFNLLPVNGDFMVVGSTEISNVTCGWALMLDDSGDAVWNHTYLEGSMTELRCAINLTDGYLLVGNQFNGADQNGFVLRVDFLGNVVWQTVLGGNQTDKLFGGVDVADGFVVYGLTDSYGNLQTAGWVVKLDCNGNVVWNRSYVQGADCAFRSGVAAGGGLTVAGYTDRLGEGHYDFLLLKIGSDGVIIWNQTYVGVQSEKAYSMTSAGDGYVLVGEAESVQTSTDALVLKVDSNGNTLWNRTLSGTQADSPSYVTQSRDGNFLVCGFTFSFGEGNRDFWLFKISSAGEVLFSCTYGTDSFQEAYSVVDLGDNHYLMTGWTDPPSRPDLIGKAQYDFLVAELDVFPSTGAKVNVWLTVASAVSVAALITTLVLLLGMRPKKQK